MDNIIMTNRNVGYDAQGSNYHFSARFNQNAQILSFGVDILNVAAFDEVMELFEEEFKPSIYELIEDSIVIPEPLPDQPEEEPVDEPEDGEEDAPSEEGNEEPSEGENE